MYVISFGHGVCERESPSSFFLSPFSAVRAFGEEEEKEEGGPLAKSNTYHTLLYCMLYTTGTA